MNLLLDTHVVLWWLADDPELRAAARDAISDRSNVVYVSAVSAWEIVVKRSLGKLEIPEEWADVLSGEPFMRMAVSWEHVLAVARLPDVHRDPFDRLLVAQATIEHLTLVTRDGILAKYGVPILNA